MNKDLTLKEKFNIKLNYEEEEIFEAIILPAYLRVFKNTNKVPRVDLVGIEVEDILYSQAKGVLYNITREDLTDEKIARILSQTHCVHENRGLLMYTGVQIMFGDAFYTKHYDDGFALDIKY